MNIHVTVQALVWLVVALIFSNLILGLVIGILAIMLRKRGFPTSQKQSEGDASEESKLD